MAATYVPAPAQSELSLKSGFVQLAAEPVTAASNVPDRAQSELSLKSEPPVQLALAPVTLAPVTAATYVPGLENKTAGNKKSS